LSRYPELKPNRARPHNLLARYKGSRPARPRRQSVLRRRHIKNSRGAPCFQRPAQRRTQRLHPCKNEPAREPAFPLQSECRSCAMLPRYCAGYQLLPPNSTSPEGRQCRARKSFPDEPFSGKIRVFTRSGQEAEVRPRLSLPRIVLAHFAVVPACSSCSPRSCRCASVG